MKYFYDTEFLEGPQEVYQWGMKADTWLRLIAVGFILLGVFIASTFSYLTALYFLFPAAIVLGLSFPGTPPTIDLISIGMVDEKDNELYLICNEFNLAEAWGRFQMIKASGDLRNKYPDGLKEYWIRNNVLKPIFHQLVMLDRKGNRKVTLNWDTSNDNFTRKNMKKLLKAYGTSREDIKKKILAFTEPDPHIRMVPKEVEETGDIMIYLHNTPEAQEWRDARPGYTEIKPTPMELWAYYSAYDHVVLSWIFGLMIKLPSYFPMYTNDLEQVKNTVYNKMKAKHAQLKLQGVSVGPFISNIKDHPKYPKNKGAHDALQDAKWNKELYIFLHTVVW